MFVFLIEKNLLTRKSAFFLRQALRAVNKVLTFKIF